MSDAKKPAAVFGTYFKVFGQVGGVYPIKDKATSEIKAVRLIVLVPGETLSFYIPSASPSYQIVQSLQRGNSVGVSGRLISHMREIVTEYKYETMNGRNVRTPVLASMAVPSYFAEVVEAC